MSSDRYRDATESSRVAMAFVGDLNRLNSLDEIRHTTASAIRGFGIEYFAMVDLPSQALNLPMNFFLNAFPPGWVDLYLERTFDSVDPVIRKARSTSELFSWDAAYDLELDPEAHDFMKLAGEYGLLNGISLSVRQPRGPINCVSLASRHRLDLDAGAKAALHLIALYALARAEVLRAPEKMTVPDLSIRELEVLKWSAVGKTSGQIASILRITERTTLAHAINATNKLGASNRTHAVVRALALGLISV